MASSTLKRLIDIEAALHQVNGKPMLVLYHWLEDDCWVASKPGGETTLTEAEVDKLRNTYELIVIEYETIDGWRGVGSVYVSES